MGETAAAAKMVAGDLVAAMGMAMMARRVVVAVALVVAMGWILSSVKRVIAGEYGRLTR